jgi:nucleoside phosphorylase
VRHHSSLWSIQPNRVYKGEYNRIKYKLITNSLAPWMDPTLKVEMVSETSAVISTTILLNSFKPDLIVSASTVGGWSNRFNVSDMGICANSNTIPYSDRNVSINTGYLIYRWGHFPCTAIVPQSVMQALNVKHALIVTHHSFVTPPNKAAHITAWGADMVKQEGATVAQEAMLHSIPYMKVRGVVNSYALPKQNCAADIFFSCWQNNTNKVATTIAMIDAMFNNN